jgi:hypothetical protein
MNQPSPDDISFCCIVSPFPPKAQVYSNGKEEKKQGKGSLLFLRRRSLVRPVLSEGNLRKPLAIVVEVEDTAAAARTVPLSTVL